MFPQIFILKPLRSMKISIAIDGYFLDRGLQLASTTTERYRIYLHEFCGFACDCEIETITHRDITRFLLHLSQRGLSNRSLNDARSILSTLWAWAAGELGIENIVGRVAPVSYRQPEIIPYTRHELQRLLDVAAHNKQWRTRAGNIAKSKRPTALRDRAIILTLIDTGIRASELCDLLIADYDDQRGRLHIRHGKGGKGRFVITGKRTRKALWRYLGSRPEAKRIESLFTTKDGNRLDRNNLYSMVRRFGERAGVDGAGIHRFRHTFAVTFLRNGGNVFELQELMGHADIRTLTVYIKLSELDIDQAQRYSPADNWKL